MAGIILEGALFIAVIAVLVALFAWLFLYRTPIGVRLQQARNRARIEGAAERHCPIHGAHEQHEMVRLPNGARMCPQCYKEALHDYSN